MEKIVRLDCIGCGGFTGTHLPQLKHVENVRVIAVAATLPFLKAMIEKGIETKNLRIKSTTNPSKGGLYAHERLYIRISQFGRCNYHKGRKYF